MTIRFRDEETRGKARIVLEDNQQDLSLADQGEGSDLKLVATLKPTAIKRIQEFAIKQNMGTLHNRINELGVAEPVIAQQGADRMWSNSPGSRIPHAKAKDILGRTATLEIRMVDDTPGHWMPPWPAKCHSARNSMSSALAGSRCWSRNKWY